MLTIQAVSVMSQSPSLWYCYLLYPVWNHQDMNHPLKNINSKRQLQMFEGDGAEVSYNYVCMRSRLVQIGVIHTHKQYCCGLRVKKKKGPTTSLCNRGMVVIQNHVTMNFIVTWSVLFMLPQSDTFTAMNTGIFDLLRCSS